MPVWGFLYFAMALALTIGCLALIIEQLHMVQRAEQEAWIREQEKRIQLITK